MTMPLNIPHETVRDHEILKCHAWAILDVPTHQRAEMVIEDPSVIDVLRAYVKYLEQN